MKWFYIWLNRKCREAHEQHTDVQRSSLISTNSSKSKYRMNTVREEDIDSGAMLDRERSLRFQVYQAAGGRVVQTQRYDRHSEESTSNLYIISNDQNFGHEIDKIITMEALKR